MNRDLWNWLFVDDELTKHFIHLRENGASPSEAFFYKRYPLAFVPHPKNFKADDPIVQKLKSEEFFRLSCIMSGSAVVPTDNGVQQLFAGDAVIDKVSSSQPVTTISDNTVMLNCMFRREFMDPCSLSRIGNPILSDYFNKPHAPDAHLILHGNHKGVIHLLMNAVNAYLQDMSSSFPESAFYALLLMTEFAKSEIIVNGDYSIGNENDIFAHRLREIIFNNIRDVDLELLSSEYGYNKTYVSDMISRITGMKFTEHVRQVRISYAKDLLERTDMPIEQIAYLSGFDNTGRFFQVFKHEVQMTPGSYRKSLLSKSKPG